MSGNGKLHEPVVVEALRTPIGRHDGALAGFHPVDMMAYLLDTIVSESGVAPEDVDDVMVGCNSQLDEQGLNIGRMAVLASSFPEEVPAVSVNRMCASSDQASHFASRAIATGDKDIVIAGGVESMSRVPIGSDGGGISREVSRDYRIIPQGNSAELMAQEWDLSRQEMDGYSLESHRRAKQAWEEGRFDREVVPIDFERYDGETITLDRDEGIRPDTSLDKMASLEPAFEDDGTITAGNSSQISDGAAALLIMSRQEAKRRGLEPRARFRARVNVGTDPTLQLKGPIRATRRALEDTGLTLEDLDVLEVNEAFASVVLAWERELSPSDLDRVNPNGGAISLGHPLGATGARLLVTLLHELERVDGRLGLSTMCIGHGLGNATVLERIP